ncbi:hypothetical protein BDZ97DRAFT_1755663 [Flammula alnicola]|nr:hypothetical protein BDZ97DRAFT_1755663 [Flammula alnicola]
MPSVNSSAHVAKGQKCKVGFADTILSKINDLGLITILNALGQQLNGDWGHRIKHIPFRSTLQWRVEGHARKSPVNLDHTSMSQHQLERKPKGVEKSLRKEKLLRLNTLRRLRIHEQTYQVFFNLVGANDVPGLHRILMNSKRRGWSAEKLLDRTREALDGRYHPKDFSDLEFDLSIAIYELGGGAALYALQKSPFAFASRTTFISRCQDYKLCITVGSVKMLNIMANIEAMFKDVKPGHRKAGMTPSMDELASDGRPCYLTDSDEIGGHSGTELPSVIRKLQKETRRIYTLQKRHEFEPQGST